MARKPKSVKYYSIPEWRRVVATTQRAASASMVESLKPHDGGGSYLIEPKRVAELRKQGFAVLLWIRDPLDRLACAYHVFGNKAYDTEFNNIHEWVDYVCKHENPHWSPQVYLHTYKGTFLPTRVYSFEDLAASWDKELPTHPLIHIGANPDRLTWMDLEDRMSNLDKAKIYEHWEDDFILYSKAQQRGYWTPEVEYVA